MPRLHRSAKLLAWFAIANGILSVVTPWIFVLIAGALPPLQRVLIDASLGVACAVSGVFGLRRRQWAFWVPMLIFLAQIVEFGSDQLIFALGGPIAVKQGWYWQDPPGFFSINILAVAMVALFGREALRIYEEDNAAPQGSEQVIEPSEA